MCIPIKKYSSGRAVKYKNLHAAISSSQDKPTVTIPALQKELNTKEMTIFKFMVRIFLVCETHLTYRTKEMQVETLRLSKCPTKRNRSHNEAIP